MSNNIKTINTLALQIKGQVEFSQDGIPSFATTQAEVAYNNMITPLYEMAEMKAEKYAESVQQSLDVTQMVSIALIEGVRKAFDMWQDDKFPFYSTFSKAIKLLFIDYARSQNRQHSKALTTYCVPEVSGKTEDLSFFDTVEDKNSDYQETFASTDFLKSIADQLSDDEKKVLYVLSTVTGKEKGQAFAVVFGKPYDSSLRKKVERAKKHIASIVTNA